MKKIIIALILSMFVLVACTNDTDKATDKNADKESKISKEADDAIDYEDVEEWMKEKALDSIEKLDILAGDKDYISITSGSSEIQEIIEEWSKAEIDEDSSILVVDTNVESIDSYLMFMSAAGAEDVELTDVAKDMLKSRIGSSIPSIINGRMGAMNLAASSMLLYGQGYVTDIEFDNQLWIIPTDEEGLAYAVNFQRSEEGIASVAANYICFTQEKTLKKSIKPMLMMFDIDEKEIDWD